MQFLGVAFMTKHRKSKEKMIQSTLRLPYSLWKRINKVADAKRLSQAQTIERAVLVYCYVNDPEDYLFVSEPVAKEEWEAALREMTKKRK
jgi:hypothetical protein